MLRAALLGAVAVAMVLLLVPRSSERQVRALLEKTAEQLRPTPSETAEQRLGRVQAALTGALAPDARVEIPGLFVGTGRAPASRAAVEQLRSRDAVLSIEQLEVTLRGDARASATFAVLLSGAQAGDLHAQRRDARAELERRDGHWQVVELRVSPAGRAEPEARP